MNNRVQRVFVCDNVLTSSIRQRVSSSPGYSNHLNQKQYDRRGALNDIEPNRCNADTKYTSNINCLCVDVPKHKSKSASHFKDNPNCYESNIENGYYMEAGPSCAKSNHTDKIKYATVRNAPPSENDLRSFDYDSGTDDTDTDDDVFFVAETQSNLKKLSPILKNKRTAEHAVITSPAVKRLNRKKTETAKNQTSSKLEIHHVFGRLHNREYILDNITYLVSNENHHLVEPDKFQEKQVNLNARAVVIDWLIKIQEQLSMTRITFLQTVRLFDNILTSTNVAINMYQLVAITCYWILSKYNDPVFANSRTILTLTGGAYDIRQLRNMELKIFDYMNCKCNIVDPSAFLEYYVICSGVQNKNILLASYYMLELMTLSPYFSTFPPSLLALSSFYLASRTLKENFKFMRNLQKCQVYYDYDETSLTQQRIWKILERVITKKIPFQSCYNKYRTIEYNFISFVITKALTNK
nr:G2/mitotic-specific cyclin-B1-like [Onthophagus taurus]